MTNEDRVPHEVALAIIRGDSPVLAFRNHNGLTLRQLSDKTGVTASSLSEIEHGHKAGSVSVLSRIARALNTTVDTLLVE